MPIGMEFAENPSLSPSCVGLAEVRSAYRMHLPSHINTQGRRLVEVKTCHFYPQAALCLYARGTVGTTRGVSQPWGRGLGSKLRERILLESYKLNILHNNCWINKCQLSKENINVPLQRGPFFNIFILYLPMLQEKLYPIFFLMHRKYIPNFLKQS